MASISANVTGFKQYTFRILGHDYYMTAAIIDKSNSQLSNGDTVTINDNSYSTAQLTGLKRSVVAQNFYSSGQYEMICNINNDETIGDDYLYVKRNTRSQFIVKLGTISTQTINLTSSGSLCPIGILIETSDGVFYADGITIAQYSSDYLYDYTDYFPCIISKGQNNLQSGFFTTSTIAINNGTRELGAYLLGHPVPTDPYNGAGDSGTGGGDGTFDGSSDPVPVPSLPSIGATDTGFISLFVPSASQIRQVASYLWSNFFDLATFKKLFEDPMDCILGLSVVPVSVPTSGNAAITVGNVELSGISLPLASQQYVEIDCGTVDFTRRYFGSYLDFEPYTKMSLFVPYSGVHAICADDVIGKVVGLKYHIDILTGSLVAFLTCGNSVLYEFNGACASNIPVNSMNYASTIENAIRIAVNIGTTVATAGAAAPLTGENAAARTAAKEFGTKVSIAGSTAEGALSLKPSIDRAGSLGGTTGLMGNQIPYFIITRPRMCKPKNQDVFQGYPSFIQTTLGDMEGTGFTAFENVILAGSYLTDTEKSELESILTAGVYL